jgi:hypothetical protein
MAAEFGSLAWFVYLSYETYLAIDKMTLSGYMGAGSATARGWDRVHEIGGDRE